MKLISIHPIRTRKDRTEWLHHNFKDIFKKGVVLDVGCADASLRNMIGKDKYFGIDIAGNYDLKINLENSNFYLSLNKGDAYICNQIFYV